MTSKARRPTRGGPRLVALGLALAALAGCTISTEDVDYTAGYGEALAQAGDAPGSPESVERFQEFMGALSVETVERDIDRVYAPDAYFNDNLTEIRGREAIKAYFLRSLEQMEQLSVRYEDVVRSDADWYLRWTLEMRFASLRDGALVTTSGMSHLRFDASGRVVVHRDHWDTASGLYEHIPGIGNAIGDIKDRL